MGEDIQTSQDPRKATKYYSPRWPETIPDNWHWVRVDWIAKEVRKTLAPSDIQFDEVFHYSIPIIDETGTGRFETPESIKSKKTHIRGGEVLVSKLNPGKSRVLTSKKHDPITLASTEFVTLQPDNEKVISEYLTFVFKSEPVRQYLAGITTSATRSHQRVNPTEIRKIVVPLPPVQIQENTLSLLNYYQNSLDIIIKNKNKLVRLLEEHKSRNLTNIITRGLNSHQEFIECTIPEINKIPEDWDEVKVGWVIDSIRNGWSPNASSNPAEGDEYGVLKLSAISKGEFKPNENKALNSNTNVDESFLIEKGDVLVTRANTPELVADACTVDQLPRKLISPDLVFIIKVDKRRLVPQFVSEWLVTAPSRAQIRADAHGSSGSMVKVSQNNLKSWKMPLPPIAEQKDIIEEIYEQRQKYSKLQQQLENSIALLEEKRQSLITAAVTGQIDLSDWDSQEDQELPA